MTSHKIKQGLNVLKRKTKKKNIKGVCCTQSRVSVLTKNGFQKKFYFLWTQSTKQNSKADGLN